LRVSAKGNKRCEGETFLEDVEHSVAAG
jgi:hypothetical protein